MNRVGCSLLASIALLSGCEKKSATILTGFDPGPTPVELAPGEAAFNRNCSSCHGGRAIGSTTAPPLVHIIYEPSHHGDEAFRRAIAQGAVAHHWSFGPMPPVPNLPPDDVEAIIRYVRWLQQRAGIT